MRLLARLAQGVVVVIIASSIAFLLIKSVKGDLYSLMLMNPNLDANRIEQLRTQFGNNTPFLNLYWNWLSGVLHGDLQGSSGNGEPVIQSIGRTLPNTLLLMGIAYCSSLLAGIALGTWQAIKEGTATERAASALTFTIFSLPDFWVAMLLQFIFVFVLGWFPAGGTSGFDMDPSFVARIVDRVRHVALPWFTLTIIDVAVFARYQRAAMHDVVGQQFLRTARAKGVPERLVTWKHAIRVAVLPMITIAGMYFPALLVGAIFIETVFGWPGVGRLLATAVEHRDYLLVSGIVVMGSAMTVLGSILADFAREVADPRLRT